MWNIILKWMLGEVKSHVPKTIWMDLDQPYLPIYFHDKRLNNNSFYVQRFTDQRVYTYKTLQTVESYTVADHVMALTFDAHHVTTDLLTQWHEHVMPVQTSQVVWVLPLFVWQKIRTQLLGWKIKKEMTLDKLCFNFQPLKDKIPDCASKYQDLSVFAYVVLEWFPIYNPVKTEALSWLSSVDPETIGPPLEEECCCENDEESYYENSDDIDIET